MRRFEKIWSRSTTMWLHVWWLTLLLEFTLADEPKGRYFYGLKHVRITEDTCAVIVGRELRKTETAFRREKVSAPCVDGPYAFGIYKPTKYMNQASLWMCYVESGSMLQCWMNGKESPGFVEKVFSLSVTNCSMDSYEHLSIAINAEVTLYSSTHICKCNGITGCGTKIPMTGACPVKEIDQCTCNNRIMSYGGIMCRRSETGFFYLKDGTNMWEYVFWPRYDYFVELDEIFYNQSFRFILFNHMVKDDICTISTGYAFETSPFYYFDTVVMVDGKYEHVCLDQEAKFAVAIVLQKSNRFFGCFLSTNGRLQCGVFINTYFVHWLDSHLDLGLCNYSTADYFLSVHDHSDTSTNITINLCSKEFSNVSASVKTLLNSCCSYRVMTTMDQTMEFKNSTFMGITPPYLLTFFHLSNTETVIRFFNKADHNHAEIYMFTANWDAFAVEQVSANCTLDRLYGIAYVRKRNYCLLEYRQPNHLIQDYSIPCMPETGLKLFHLTSLDRYNFVEVCHYSSENHSITCYDHYTNAMSLYSLRGCTLYSKGDANYLFGYGTGIRIGDELSACTIERIDPGQFMLKTKSIVDGLVDPPLLQIKDPVCGNETTLTEKSLKFMDATGFDYVCGSTVLKTDECSYFYDNITNEFHAISEGFDYTFFLSWLNTTVFIPDPERRCTDYEPRLHAYHCYIILAIDVVLLALFLVVVVFEIKGFRLFMFEEVRQELIDKKMANFDAHYYF